MAEAHVLNPQIGATVAHKGEAPQNLGPFCSFRTGPVEDLLEQTLGKSDLMRCSAKIAEIAHHLAGDAGIVR